MEGPPGRGSVWKNRVFRRVSGFFSGEGVVLGDFVEVFWGFFSVGFALSQDECSNHSLRTVLDTYNIPIPGAVARKRTSDLCVHVRTMYGAN